MSGFLVFLWMWCGLTSCVVKHQKYAEEDDDEKGKIKNIVGEALRESHRARDDDKYLVWYVWHKLSKRTFIPFEDFEKLPSPETITRWRRYYQNTLGLYVGKGAESKKEFGDAEEKVLETNEDFVKGRVR